jgi:hypothetical protein
MAYSDEILEATPERVTRLLTGIGAVATIRTLLFEAGMTDDDIREGRELLLACLAAPSAPRVATDTDAAQAQRAAVAELDEWDEPNFARYQAALHRHFPDAEVYVFNALSASTGVSAVAGVATFLQRVAALESGSDPERNATRKDDKKAVDLLARRGLHKAERARLAARVDVALGPTDPLPEVPTAPLGGDRRAALTKLRDWYEEWSAAARAVVKKKAYRIRLGLATRKPPTRKAGASDTKAAPGAKAPEGGAKKPE